MWEPGNTVNEHWKWAVTIMTYSKAWCFVRVIPAMLLRCPFTSLCQLDDICVDRFGRKIILCEKQIHSGTIWWTYILQPHKYPGRPLAITLLISGLLSISHRGLTDSENHQNLQAMPPPPNRRNVKSFIISLPWSVSGIVFRVLDLVSGKQSLDRLAKAFLYS
jgi:hypothetical protein